MKSSLAYTWILAFLLLSLLMNCGNLSFREVTCREFSNEDNLRFFPGQIGHDFTFVLPDSSLRTFRMYDKYLYHRTKYISDTGCGCIDGWGLVMNSGRDTISMYGEARYVEDNAENKYFGFNITYDDVLTSFTEENMSNQESIELDSVSFHDILLYSKSTSNTKQFNRVIIASEIGILRMERQDGLVLENQDLQTRLNIDIDSFFYFEGTCE